MSTTSLVLSSQVGGDTELNMLHLELIHHWSNGLYKSFLLSGDSSSQIYVDTCIKHGLRHPFLMRQILATSALHISIERPDQRAFYHQHANQLQSDALAGFNTILQGLDESNILAAFLVSSLIGTHVFCETFLFREATHDTFNSTLDSLIGCINLLRGIRSIISDWWSFLCESELGSVLMSANEQRDAYKQASNEIGVLNQMVDAADIGIPSREAYKKTIQELEKVFAAQSQLDDLQASTSANMVFSWLVLVPKEFVELLSARRPEALVILSYYAVVLHHRRKFWAINDAGEYLIPGIGSHLGRHWDQWLAWPRQVIATS